LEGLIWRLSTEEEMEATIEKIAKLIDKYDLEAVAVLFFESVKPLTPMGAALSRVFVAPWLHLIGINTRHVINTLEEPKNIEKLLKRIEERENEKRKARKEAKTEEKKDIVQKKEEAEAKSKRGWRRFLPL